MSVYTPTIHVEVAFGYSPLQDTTDGSFVDLSARTDLIVESCTIARGRPSEFDQFPPGTCQIQITDRNRILDPQNTSGPYYGQLLPRVPIRVRSKVGGTYYPRFFGYVDGWPMQLLQGHATIVNVTATDGFKILNGARLNQSAYDDAVLDSLPNAYWKLGEQTGDLAADHSGNNYHGVYSAGVGRADQIVPFADNGSASYTFAVNQSVTVFDTGARVDALPATVEFWARLADAPASQNGQLLFLQPAYGSNDGFAIYTDTDFVNGLLLSYVGADDAYSTFAYWNVDMWDGRTHHYAFVIDVGVRDFYFDGNLVTPARNSTSANVAKEVTPIYIGSYEGLLSSIEGLVSNVALYDTALSAADILAHYQAGVAPSDTDTPGGRIEYVLDLVDWPTALKVLDQGEMLLAPADLEGRTALEYMRLVEASEQGRLFMTKDGKVAFHQRDRFITVAAEGTTQYTFSDDGAGNSLHALAGITYDDRFTYNVVRVTREGGNPVTVADLTSQALYGPLTRALDGLLLLNDAQSRALGERIVYRYKNPQPRASTWAVQPELDSANWPDLFALEIGYRVALEATPASRGSQLVMGLHIEQIIDTITPGSYEIAFAGSSVDANAGTYFRFNGDGSTQGWGFGVWR